MPLFPPIHLLRKRLPHFLVLGAQKAGTTSLQKLLEHHPRVYLPPCKEVQYFSSHSERPISWYSNHYLQARWHQKRGDITPFYLFHPKAPMRIYSLLPNVKMMVLLRDPVERALSQFFHAQRHGFETLEIEEALAAEEDRIGSGSLYSLQKHSYVARSRYLEQLDRYESLFPKKQLLILKSEDFFNRPEGIWKEILHFLTLPVIPLTITLPNANKGQGEAGRVAPVIRKKLREALAETASGVKQRYGIDWGWD